MPREVSDIKKFLEICRRNDASCSSLPPPCLTFDTTRRVSWENCGQFADQTDTMNSGSDKAQSQVTADEVQGPVSSVAVYARVEGFG